MKRRRDEVEVKAKAIKNIFSEATEEQVNAISKLMEKQAEEHSAEIAKLQEQLTAANNQIKEFQSMNIDYNVTTGTRT